MSLRCTACTTIHLHVTVGCIAKMLQLQSLQTSLSKEVSDVLLTTLSCTLQTTML